MIEQQMDLIIIGGGAAGLAAAIAAKKEGVDSILIIERNENLGGILPQCIHTGFGFHYFKENLTGPEYLNRFIEEIYNLGISYKLDTTVLDIDSDRGILALNSKDGLMKFRAKAIVLAMGCRERSRGALNIPGTRPSGVFTAGTAQRLMDIEGYSLGKRILIIGSGDIGLIMVRRFAMEGCEVKGVVEITRYLGGLDRNLQILKDFTIPLYLSHTVTSIRGADRVEAVTISELNENGQPMNNTEKTIKCDTLILSVGLLPENELSKRARVKLDPKTGGPIVDENMETSVKGIFACGNVVHVHDLVDHVTLDGEETGRNAARKILGKLPPLKKEMHLKAEGNLRYLVPQIISGEKPVRLYGRVIRPAINTKIRIGKALIIKKKVVKPAELVTLDLTVEMIKDNYGEKEFPIFMDI